MADTAAGGTTLVSDDASSPPSAEAKLVELRLQAIRRGEHNVDDILTDNTTAFHFCAHKGLLEQMKQLQVLGADIHATGRQRKSALHYAAVGGHTHVLIWLIENGAILQPAAAGWTALMYACLGGKLEAATYLMSIGDSVHATTDNGNTPLVCAVQRGHIAVAEALLSQGADIDAANHNGWTPLLWSVCRGQEAMAGWLINKGSNIRAVTRDLCSVAMWASEFGVGEVLVRLLGLGVDPNEASAAGNTPVIFATWKDNVHILEILHAAGASLHAVNAKGWNAAVWAASKGFMRSLQWLAERGCDVNLPTHQDNTALMLAAENGHIDCVEYLLQKGADIAHVNKAGSTALDLTAKGTLTPRKAAAALVLVKHGSRVQLPMTPEYAATVDLKTAVWAIRVGFASVVEYFLASARLELPFPAPYNPMITATSAAHGSTHDNPDVVHVLSSYGADINAADDELGTPIRCAIKAGRPLMVQALLMLGAEICYADLRAALEVGDEATIISLLGSPTCIPLFSIPMP